MKIISNNLNASLSLLLSSGLLFGAYFLEFYLSLIPCDLCIKQRIVHVSILLLSLLIFPLYTFSKLKFTLLSILNLLWLGSSSLAFYHFGIEKKLWQGFSECSSNLIFNENTLDQANSDVMFLHCLPAIKGQEISTTLLDDQRSRVWRQAENRLHAQKGLLIELLN